MRGIRRHARLWVALLAATLSCAPVRPAPVASEQSSADQWLEGSVIYGVVPGLFGTEPLKAVTQKLDYLRSMGVDAVWLPPVNTTNDPGNISYLITDYFALRPDYGTPDDLRQLVHQAHARG